MIPKIIHYCWFGGKPKPALVNHYIETWKHYCPDYTFMEWNESNFNIQQNAYCKEAYEAEKWAFVSDYVRVKVLYDYGGIYMDTDVELVQSIDALLNYEIFMGFENDKMVSIGTIGSNPHNGFLKEILQVYASRHFLNDNGSFNMMPNVELVTKLLIDHHGLLANGRKQLLNPGIQVFPMESFVAKDYWTGWVVADESTYAIHHYASTWLTKQDRKLIAKERQYIRYIYKRLQKPVHFMAAFKATLELAGIKGIVKKIVFR